MVRPNRTRTRKIACIVISSIVFSTSAGHCAGHFYNVEAAEGIVGAIAGNFTLWDLATTALGAAGFMIVNKDVQDTARTHLGGNEYTLDYLLEQGLIEVNEQPAYTWDWSGLKSLMQDWNDYADSRPLDQIRQAAIENGIEFDDLWIDTFKQFVENGKIGVDQIATGISVSVQDLAEWIGNAFSDNVASKFVITAEPQTLPNGSLLNFYYSIVRRDGVYEMARLNAGYTYNVNLVRAFPYVYKSGSYANIGYILANRASTSIDSYFYYYFEEGSNPGWSSQGSAQSISAKSYYRSNEVTFNPARGWTSSSGYSGDSNVAQQTALNEAMQLANSWINTDPVSEPYIPQSPDIMTPSGAATMPNVGTWAPNPYLGGVDWPDAWLQPVPAGAWSPAIDDLLDAPALPAPGEAGDFWDLVFDPYITDNPDIDIPGEDVEPVPTVVPRPTTAAGEGTWDEPYAVVPANPVPSIEDGAGQLPNIVEFFPFCIPGDFVFILKLLWSEDNVRTAPHIYLPLRVPSINFSYDIDIDFASFEESAELLRTLVLISFCIALAILTKNLIWS